MKKPHCNPSPIEFMKKHREDPNYNAMMRIVDISKLHRSIARRMSEQEGLPSSYRLMLFHLSMLEPGVSQLELVKSTHLKPPTVSVTLQKMEADGYIIRKSNEHDLRQTLVYLSEKGKSVNERIHTSFVESDRLGLRGITDEEQAELCRLLDKVIDNLLEADEK